jgi:nucleoside-diphosphate-sugar epimerase
MKIRITGHTKGLGKDLYEHYVNQGHDVIGFNSKNTIEEIINQSEGCDLFINNAYSDGTLQIELLKKLYLKVEKMIVMGSIVTVFRDPNEPDYTLTKMELETAFMHLAVEPKRLQAKMLLLRLSSSSYKDTKTIINSINFWIDNPTVISLSFSVND